MKRVLSAVMLTLLALSLPVFAEGEAGGGKVGEKRAKLDAMASETLSELFSERAGAKKLFDQAYGYAVFSNIKISLGLTGGGGNGVAVAGDGRTYMRMGTGGVNFGLGGQKYQVVFLFENSDVFRDFVDNGWQADASANAAAGKAGANAGTSFRNGMAVYQITDKGLMLQADLSGTKYWKNKKLN
jgi:lipid-binding SYLF domain-containing protein